MTREELLALLTPFGFTATTWEYDDSVSLEHPLSEDFYFNIKKNDTLPTPSEVIADFYHSARRDESNDHRCW